MKDTIIKILLIAIIIFQVCCVLFQFGFWGYDGFKDLSLDLIEHGTVVFICYVLYDMKKRG